jgi:hypothetical protein
MRTPLVGDVMTREVVTVRSFAPFRELITTMLSRGVGALPVVDSIGHPIGIVSRTDLLAKQAATDSTTAEAWELLSPRGRKVRWRWKAASSLWLERSTAGRVLNTRSAGPAVCRGWSTSSTSCRADTSRLGRPDSVRAARYRWARIRDFRPVPAESLGARVGV